MLFELPCWLPFCCLRSLSLWARHSAETSAELNVRSVRRNFSPWPAGSARVRKRRGEGKEWTAKVGPRYTIQRTIPWLKNRSQVGPQFSSSARPDPPLLPSIIFPLGPPFCGDQCRAERALGAAEFFPVASRQVRGGGSGGGKEMSGRRGSSVGTRHNVRSSGCRTAVRWGPQLSSSAPPRSPAPP